MKKYLSSQTLLASWLACTFFVSSSLSYAQNDVQHIPELAKVGTQKVASSQPTAFTMSSDSDRTPEQIAVSFKKADLSFQLFPQTKSLEALAKLNFQAQSPVDTIVVELDKNLGIQTITENGVSLPNTSYQNPEGRLTIHLQKPLKVGDSVEIGIQYAGVPLIAKLAPWDGGFVWATAPSGHAWIATAIQSSGCDIFWPCIDHPQARPEQVDLHITVPNPLVVAGNGVFKGVDNHGEWSTHHWHIKNPSTYGISLNVGPFKFIESQYKSRYGNTIPLQFWYLPENEAKAQAMLVELASFLDFFENKLGPYPFGDEKAAAVESPHLGMEHQTINAYGNDYKKSFHGYDWLLQHEFSHEWFGNQLTNAHWNHFWLHEGFASYMQPLYLLHSRGERDYQYVLYEQRKQFKNMYPVVLPQDVSEKDEKKHAPGNDVYYKGSHILHTLRGLIGDDAFYKSVRQLIYGRQDPKPGNFKPRLSTTQEFMKIVNAQSKQNYDWMFKAYLMNAKLPELVSKREGDLLTLEWKLPNHEKEHAEFPMPIDVMIDKKLVKLPMKNGKGQIKVPAFALVTIDPYSKVLRHEPEIDIWKKDEAERKSKNKK